MKRRAFSLILCLALVAAFFSAIPTPAMAASQACTVGQKVWWVFDVEELSEATMAYGLPPGLTLGNNDGCYIIHGTPTEPGTYSVTVWYHCYFDSANGDYDTYGSSDKHTITVLAPRSTFSGHEFRTAAPSATPSPSPSATPSASPSATPSASPSASPSATPAGAPVITKHPTKETVTEGAAQNSSQPPQAMPGAHGALSARTEKRRSPMTPSAISSRD